jgi:hypothetical protein
VPFGPDNRDGLSHQVHGSDRMLKTGVVGPGVDKMCQSQLPDPSEPLEPRMFYQIVYKVERDLDKSVYRIIDDFQLVGGRKFPHKAGLWAQNYVFIAIIGFVSAKKPSDFCELYDYL